MRVMTLCKFSFILARHNFCQNLTNYLILVLRRYKWQMKLDPGGQILLATKVDKLEQHELKKVSNTIPWKYCFQWLGFLFATNIKTLLIA